MTMNSKSKTCCRKAVLLMFLVLFAGMSAGCGKDAEDDTAVERREADVNLEFEYEGEKVAVENLSGVMMYDKAMACWTIRYVVPNTYDSVIHYYPASLNSQFKKENLKVVFSGDAVKMKQQAPLAGLEYYGVFLKAIKTAGE